MRWLVLPVFLLGLEGFSHARSFCFSVGVDVTTCAKGFLCCGVGMEKGVGRRGQVDGFCQQAVQLYVYDAFVIRG